MKSLDLQKNTYGQAGRTLPLLERDKDGYSSTRLGKSNKEGEFFLYAGLLLWNNKQNTCIVATM
ncbi:hypothetical protein EEL32_18240 [Brevibacillus laterosporus]|uniref:Uncharacterized protein n=1 Tax=Brevibacillus laterosporus TaxID=1465 RepID=A0A502I9R7_BRELA|nr:hypothetical protein [Brevibacillus laterosporus]QDX94554.1 hypothetical protein EEL30_21110 [Brevibacillus laterosporus]RAP30874.1 hypothetical protein C2W64_00041 [Brevibacillus laterosporus]TPG68442.1 hypothetical protein EEL31_07860 [Brevibacillus laterosporus]TPG83045.1 hypothetical protein EEL32_18240 [Brevibacillus laterosporus]